MASGSRNVDVDMTVEDEEINQMFDEGAGTTNFNLEQNDPNAKKRTRKGGQRSKVWEHMNKVADGVDEEGRAKYKAVCKLCGATFVLGKTSGLGSMTKHLQNKHGLLKNTNTVDNPMTQTQLAPDAQGNMVMWTYDEPRARRALAHYVTATERPISFADDVEFDKFVQTAFCPDYRHISRHTTRNDIIELYEERKVDIMQSFKNSDFTVACTSDMWSGRNGKGYLCVTAHYIDPSWTLQKRVIAFREVPYPHNGINMGETIVEVFNEWFISERITSITFDNASACDSAIDHMQSLIQTPFHEEFGHVRCVCHIINLMVQDGLKVLEPYISRIRDAINYISTSPKRTKQFKEFCILNNKKPRRFGGDCKTRWNSTYIMLKSVMGYETLITRFLNEQNNPFTVSTVEWEVALVLRVFLEPFYQATLQLSGVYYPTTNHVLPQLMFITDAFSEYRDNIILGDAIVAMETKFLKYFEKFPMVFCLASMLDPRQKETATFQMLEKISENMNSEYRNVCITPTPNEVKRALDKMYDKYVSKFGVEDDGTQGSSTSSSRDPRKKSKLKFGSFLKSKQKTNTSSNCVSELLLYINQNDVAKKSAEEIENLDVLEWWKDHEIQYPIVGRMARDLLTPPSSTVPSESTFSAGKRVLSEKRSCLTSEILEVLICSKDWSDANRRTQDLHPLDIAVNELYEELGINPDTTLDQDE